MQFPLEMPPGKRIPFWSQIPGRSFRLRADPETASHSEAEIWDTLSAGSQHDNRRVPFQPFEDGLLPSSSVTPLTHLGKRNQLGISPARRSIPTSLRKAALREEHIAFLPAPKELASVHELFQNVLAHQLAAPI